MTRVAAYDCGTNSLRLLIADVSAETGELVELVREMRIVRLGQDVDRTGRISDEALARTAAALEEYAPVVSHFAPTRIRFCATSAARDASNAAEFAAVVKELVGVDPEVITGEEEARASYDGATRTFPDVAEPVLVVDIGGGSTELILGDRDGVLAEHSLDIGSVRLTERHLHDDPAAPDQVDAARRDIDAMLDSCRVDPAEAATVIGVAGTVTTVAAGALGLSSYQRDRIHHADLPVEKVRATVDELVAMTVEQRLALGYMHPGRADVIAAGALILERVLERSRVTSVRVSESDILDGIAWSCLT